MRFFFYIAICLGLVVCQTALIPRLPAMGNFFDLLLPLVVYLAAFRPLHESVPFVMFLGILMDNLSGGGVRALPDLLCVAVDRRATGDIGHPGR